LVNYIKIQQLAPTDILSNGLIIIIGLKPALPNSNFDIVAETVLVLAFIQISMGQLQL
jgi:hypothetical protein